MPKRKKQKYCLNCGKEFPHEKKKMYCSDRCKLLGKIKINSDGCWEWQDYVNQHGYGYITLPNKSHMAAHRMSYNVFKGEIPKNKFVCHNCSQKGAKEDNRKCINPDHLFLGTHQENMRDAFRKGKLPTVYNSGENNQNTNLKNDTIIKIKEDFVKGMACWEVSEKYNLPLKLVNRIANHKTFKSILVPGFDAKLKISKNRPDQRGSENYSSKLTEEIVKEIRKLSQEGMMQKDIAKKINISKSLVSAIILRKRWSHIP